MNGEYDHSKYHPVRDFISGLLDTATLGILPMVELMAGYDFITGEELSSQEATNKGIEAVMGLVAIALIPFTSGGSVGLKAVGKQILVESATGVVSYTIYEAGEAMDMPAGITFALSIAGGGLTYTSLDGAMIQVGKNNSTKVSAELLDQFDSMTRNELTSYHYGNTNKITEAFFDISKANTIVKTDSAGVTWYYKELENEFERRLLSADLINYIDDVPLGYRGDLRVPDYTKIKGIQVSDTGQIRLIEAWRPGTDGAVDGTRKMVTVSSVNDDGTKVLLDRIGGEGGNYFSPLQADSTPYGLKERAIGDYLPESQIDINDSYHLYEMQQDFTRENFENAIKNCGEFTQNEKELLYKKLNSYYNDASRTTNTIGHNGEAYEGIMDGVKSGTIDKMFEANDGGAIQYITPFDAETLVKLKLIERIK